MKTLKKFWLVMVVLFSFVILTGCINFQPGEDPNIDDPLPENPEDFGTPEDFKVLESGMKYEIKDGKTIVVPKNSTTLKVIEEASKKYLLTLNVGKELALEITKDGERTVFEYDVKYRLVAFSRGSDLGSYETGNLFSNYLRLETAPYTVGYDNPYLMDLSVSAAIFDENNQTKIVNLTSDHYNLNYEIKVDGALVQLKDNATVSKAGIQFSSALDGKTVEISASLVSDKITAVVKQTVFVQKGMNVHSDQELKNAFSDLNVHHIHLHRDIKTELTEEQYFEKNSELYPYNYFSMVDEESQGNHGNAYRRYDALSIGELTVNGNYFTVDASDVPLCIGNLEDGYQGGFVDNTKPEQDRVVVSSQSSIFRFGTNNPDYTSDNWVKFKNVTVLGNTNRPNSSDMALSGGHSGLRNDKADLFIDNVNLEYMVSGIFSVYTPTKTYVDYSKISNSWASNILMWGSAYASVENSELSYSGSACITVVDSPSTKEGVGLENYLDPELVVNNTTFNNLTSGTSPWFEAYNLKGISTLVSGVDSILQTINKASGGLMDITIFGEKESSSDLSQFNFTILIQNGDPIGGGPDAAPQAKVTIDGVSVYRPYDYNKGNPFIEAVAQQGATLTPFGWDVANGMLEILMSNPDYQTALQYGTAEQKAQVINALFAGSIITGMNYPAGVNKQYLEMMPSAFTVTAIVEVYPNKK